MDPLRTGARLLSRGMRSANGALTFLGAVLVARGIMRWFDPPKRELLYAQNLSRGEELRIAFVVPDDQSR